MRAHPEGFLDAVRWGGPCSLSFAASYSGQAAAQPAASGPQVSFTLPADDPADPASRMTPKAVVERLDEYIIGQASGVVILEMDELEQPVVVVCIGSMYSVKA